LNKYIRLKIITILTLVAVGFFSGVYPEVSKSGTNEKEPSTHPQEKTIWTVYFKNAAGVEVPLYCEVVITDEEKRVGLMNRDSLEENQGMIFVYPEPQILNFWMQHTKIPLTIAFIAEKNYIISLHPMKPFDQTVIYSDNPALYAVEANVGWFRKNLVSIHDKVRIVKFKEEKKDSPNATEAKRKMLKEKYHRRGP